MDTAGEDDAGVVIFVEVVDWLSQKLLWDPAALRYHSDWKSEESVEDTRESGAPCCWLLPYSSGVSRMRESFSLTRLKPNACALGAAGAVRGRR